MMVGEVYRIRFLRSTILVGACRQHGFVLFLGMRKLTADAIGVGVP